MHYCFLPSTTPTSHLLLKEKRAAVFVCSAHKTCTEQVRGGLPAFHVCALMLSFYHMIKHGPTVPNARFQDCRPSGRCGDHLVGPVETLAVCGIPELKKMPQIELKTHTCTGSLNCYEVVKVFDWRACRVSTISPDEPSPNNHPQCALT